MYHAQICIRVLHSQIHLNSDSDASMQIALDTNLFEWTHAWYVLVCSSGLNGYFFGLKVASVGLLGFK